MDEKVIYPPKEGAGNEPATADPGQAQTTPDAQAADPNAPAAAEPAAEEQPADGAPPADPPVEGEISSDELAEGEGEEVPPPFWRRKSFLIKILIGIGVLIAIISLVTLLTKQNQPKEVTLTWWGLWEDEKSIQFAIDDFQKANPTIKIDYVKKDPKLYRKTLSTRIQNGTGPDIFRYHNSWLPMMSANLTPLSADVINPEEFKKAYPVVMQNDLVQNGAIYGIPVGTDSLAMFTNTELLTSAAPATWEDLTTMARKLTVIDPDTGKIKTAGAALGTMKNVSHSHDILSMLFVQQGIKDKTTFTDPSNAKRQQDVIDFYTAFARGDQKVWDETLDVSWLAFARGNVAIFFGYSWDIFRIQEINKTLQFKVNPVPGLQGGKNPTIASYWVEGVSSRGKNQKEALLFMQYLAQKETAQKLYTEQAKTRAFGEPYARIDLAETLQDNELVYPFVSQMPYAYSTYFASDTHDSDDGLNASLNSYLEKVINTVATSAQETDNAIKPFNLGVAQVYEKYKIVPAAAPRL